jgi:hypothetical protein
VGVGDGDMTRVVGIGCEEAMISCSYVHIDEYPGYMRVDELSVSRRCRSNGCPVPAQDDVMVSTETFRQDTETADEREEFDQIRESSRGRIGTIGM